MGRLNGFARVATTFTTTGEIDEEAFRRYLARFIDVGVGIYVASAGSGESHALSIDELRRIYEIAVAECKGRVPVIANPPEQHTARLAIEHAVLAIEAGVEGVNLYGPEGAHGFRPTDAEYLRFFDEVLGAIQHPIAIAPNPIIGYKPRPGLIADICNNYPQIDTINFTSLTDDYFIAVRSLMKREIAYNVPLSGTPITFALGATGIVTGDFNILPKTSRRYLDLCEAGDLAGAAIAYDEISRFMQYVQKWNSASPRWIKMCMRVLKLPGWEGGLRGPYLMPEEAELESFAAGLFGLGIAEIEEQVRAAGRITSSGGSTVPA